MLPTPEPIDTIWKIMPILAKLVYHLPDSHASGTNVLSWLLFLYSILRKDDNYDRKERMAGVSKYPLKKMISFALDGITSFSIKPLHYITYLGVVFILISIAVIIYALISYFDRDAIQGWTSLLISVWFIGGCILIACGVIGEYVGKIYIETKRRPLYFIEKTAGISNK